jgi:hypothetical protein
MPACCAMASRLVGEAVGRVAAQDYKAVKLHEIDVPRGKRWVPARR